MGWAMGASELRPLVPAAVPSGASGTSRDLLRRSRANELFIAIVAPAGAGAGTAANIIGSYLGQENVEGEPYQVIKVKASDAIKAWSRAHDRPIPQEGVRKSLDGIVQMQDRGDDMRKAFVDGAAVARGAMAAIHRLRAEASGRPEGEIDGRPRAFIIDSLRHPAEANLLRRVYQDAFTLVGVVCDPKTRDARLRKDLFAHKEMLLPATTKAMNAFMERDADAPEPFGQHVVDTFHEADFFVDNSRDTDDLTKTGMNEALFRLVSLVTSAKVIRPTIAGDGHAPGPVRPAPERLPVAAGRRLARRRPGQRRRDRDQRGPERRGRRVRPGPGRRRGPRRAVRLPGRPSSAAATGSRTPSSRR